MTLLYFLTMLIVAYSSIVIASHKKFSNKGITLDLKHKSLLLILPFFLFYLHLRAAKKVYRTDKAKAFRIVIVSVIKYPVMLGAFIELLKESMVECRIFGNSQLVAFKKPKKEKTSEPLNVFWDMKQFFGNFRDTRIYEKMLINAPAI